MKLRRWGMSFYIAQVLFDFTWATSLVWVMHKNGLVRRCFLLCEVVMTEVGDDIRFIKIILGPLLIMIGKNYTRDEKNPGRGGRGNITAWGEQSDNNV